MRMCSGTAGGWPGSSVVGDGWSVWMTGTAPADEVGGRGSTFTLGGEGGMCEGSGSAASGVLWGTVMGVLSSLLPPLGMAGDTAGLTEGGSGT